MVKVSKYVTIWDGKLSLGKDAYQNIVTIEGIDYELRYLGDKPGNRGGNSFVLRLVLAEDDEETQPELILKISRIPISATGRFNRSRRKRFLREIQALRKAARLHLPNVILYIHHDIISISGDNYNFYIMEKADSDLTDYLRQEKTIQQRLLLMWSILTGIQQLHSIDIYHRDIKNDNIFVFENESCKVGDLGLMRFRHEDNLDLDKGERIGAFGWETPEAMNKFYSEQDGYDSFKFDCNIDEASDVFQLGKLFWFIMQGNLPIGCLHRSDFKIDDSDIFATLSILLQQGKISHEHPNGRPLTIAALKLLLQPIVKKYQVV